MRSIDRNALERALIGVLLCIMLTFAVGVAPCSAQSYASALGSYLPLGGLETYIGPLLPPCGIGSTFRSEIYAGVSGGDVRGAKLVGSGGAEISLRQALLDEAPLRFEAVTNLRLWRFGLRAAYNDFTTRARHVNLAKIDASGLILGGDVDVVQFPWLTVGACVDFYLYDPSFQGPLFFPATRTVLNPFPPPLTLPPVAENSTITWKIVGRKPSTIGAYLRYVPPEILGYPLHVEAWYKAPLGGSKLLSWGAALVFRPQIFRFDVAAKLSAENRHLKFSNEPSSLVAQVPGSDETFLFPAQLSGQKWELDMEWNLYGLDFCIYF